ncbi:MAG: Rrf2 family transcriptional regulator [Pirellulaceae bacterium]|nr:Rrf2 family transcriptional regulator [Pirellulaceae bacterium]
MKLSRTVAYALQATVELARLESDGSPVPCNRLAAAGGISENFLLQILRNLVARGILESTRGIEGGYSLGRSANDISILEVIEAAGGPVSSNVHLDGGISPESKEKLEQTFAKVAAFTQHELEAVKLAHLIPLVDSRKPKRNKKKTVDCQQP